MKIQKLISHRGNIFGPDVSKENSPSYILNTLEQGYDCEIDIWQVDSKLFLGHDEPQYQISIDFLTDQKDNLWIHCKNFEALNYLNKMSHLNYFWHEEDRFSITSKGFIWTYPGNVVGSNSIIVDNENKATHYECYGICSDYVDLYK